MIAYASVFFSLLPIHFLNKYTLYCSQSPKLHSVSALPSSKKRASSIPFSMLLPYRRAHLSFVNTKIVFCYIQWLLSLIKLLNDVFIHSCCLCPTPSPGWTFLFAEVHPLVAFLWKDGAIWASKVFPSFCAWKYLYFVLILEWQLPWVYNSRLTVNLLQLFYVRGHLMPLMRCLGFLCFMGKSTSSLQ